MIAEKLLFKNKYRIKTTRLKQWDYGQNGWYFVTICTKDRECYFGDIKNGKMKLSNIGRIALKYWQQIPKHFPFVALDEYIIMPNHVHGIVVIDKPVETQNSNNRVETQNFASLQYDENGNKFGPQSRNLASIIRGFKIGVKKWATIHNIDFFWQPRFYDHIIRNEKSLNRIRQYIRQNPLKWLEDRNNPGNL